MIAPGTLYIIAAPSGAGKTSLIQQLVACTPAVEVSVSHTTRSPRPGEQTGVDYHFVDDETFHSLVKQGLFLEHARVFDHYYGTGRHTVLERLQTGVDIILEIDWQGARQVRSLMPRTCSVFILPASLKSLRQRLINRGQDSDAVIDRRMRDAVREMSHYNEFDYLIINDEFQEALDCFRAIFIANRQLREAQVPRHKKLLESLLS